MDVKTEAETYIKQLKVALDGINLEEITNFYELLFKCYQKGGQVFIFGNGGSAATASHFAADLNKGVSLGLEKRFKIICLNDNIPTMLAYANDLSYNDVFVEQLKNFLQKDDIVIGISGSGNSQNVLNAIVYANEKGAVTVGITGYKGGKLKQLAKHNVNADVLDMQLSEDIHLILSHIIMKLFYKKLKEE